MSFTEDSQNGDITQPKYDIYTPTLLQKYRLGTRYHRADGRSFYYSRAGGTDLIRGQLQQSAVYCSGVTEQQAMTIATASAVGDNWGYATLKTDAAIKDQYKDGWYAVTNGTVSQGGASLYQIKSHPLIEAVQSGKFTFYDKINVLISISAEAGLIMNPYNGIVQSPTTITGFVLGVTMTAVTKSYYFWLQTWGICSVLTTTLIVGEDVLAGPAIAGAVAAQDAGGASDAFVRIGHAGHTSEDTDWGFVYLQIAW